MRMPEAITFFLACFNHIHGNSAVRRRWWTAFSVLAQCHIKRQIWGVTGLKSDFHLKRSM